MRGEVEGRSTALLLPGSKGPGQPRRPRLQSRLTASAHSATFFSDGAMRHND